MCKQSLMSRQRALELGGDSSMLSLTIILNKLLLVQEEEKRREQSTDSDGRRDRQ